MKKPSSHVGELEENRTLQGAVAPRASKKRAPVTNRAPQGAVAHRFFDVALPSDVQAFYAPKKLLFATWDCESPDGHTYQNLYSAFQRVIPKILLFGVQKNLHACGKEEMNKRLLALVQKEQPDYIFLNVLGDEISLSTLVALKHAVPHAMTINFFGDDDTQFEVFSRHIALFVDYCCSTQSHVVEAYKKEGIQRVFPFIGVNLDVYRPLSLEKKYDVTFIGIPRNDRAELLQYLIDQGVNVRIWGSGWERYPGLQTFWNGFVKTDELIRIFNESKINLNFIRGGFGKGHLHMKGRVVEVAACKAFQLLEYYPQYFTLFHKKEIVMFKNKEDLLQKIRYYLEHGEEREKIAERMYLKTVKNYARQKEVNAFFYRLYREQQHGVLSRKTIPEVKNNVDNVLSLHVRDLFLNDETLRKKMHRYRYVTFYDEGSQNLPYRCVVQMHSLEKSGKEMSCCEYYVTSRSLGNVLLFKVHKAFHLLPQQVFQNLLTLHQLMVTTSYLMKHLHLFRKAAQNGTLDFINTQNTIFVSLPLVQIEHVHEIHPELMNQAFEMKFFHELAALARQRKGALIPYLARLFFTSYAGKKCVMRSLMRAIATKKNLLKALQ